MRNRVIITVFSLALASVAVFGQAKEDMKDAGKEVKNAAKATGRAAKKTGSATKKVAKKATNKTAEKMEDGAAAVKQKTQP